MKWLPVCSAVCAAVLIVACQQGPNSPRGFSLPEGDAGIGKQVFDQFQCLSCHELEGFESLPLPEGMNKHIKLGGKVSRITTYAELVTSVINPSHKLTRRYAKEDVSVEGQSKMPSLNDQMTVSELINLVSFLQAQYELHPYTPTNYGYYYIPADL